jgi:hypothetical protein
MSPARFLRNKISPVIIVLLLSCLVFFCCMWLFIPSPASYWIFGICIVAATWAVVHALVKDNRVELNPVLGTVDSMRTSWYFNRRKTSYLVSEFAHVHTMFMYRQVSSTYQARIELVTEDRKKALEVNTFDAVFEKLPPWSFRLLRESIENPNAIALRRQVSEILDIPDHGYSEDLEISLLP